MQWLAPNVRRGSCRSWDHGPVTIDDVMKAVLNDWADVLLGILASPKLIHKRDGEYTLRSWPGSTWSRAVHTISDVLYANAASAFESVPA